MMSRDSEIIELAKSGKPYDEIARQFGITKARVSQICVKHGFVKRMFEVNPDNVDDDEIRELLKRMQGV